MAEHVTRRAIFDYACLFSTAHAQYHTVLGPQILVEVVASLISLTLMAH